jgi:hypothetical protein
VPKPPKPPHPQGKTRSRNESEARAARRAQALRDNLKRRKGLGSLTGAPNRVATEHSAQNARVKPGSRSAERIQSVESGRIHIGHEEPAEGRRAPDDDGAVIADGGSATDNSLCNTHPESDEGNENNGIDDEEGLKGGRKGGEEEERDHENGPDVS